MFVRINAETKEWIQQLARDSNISMAQACGIMLDHCRKRGAKIAIHEITVEAE